MPRKVIPSCAVKWLSEEVNNKENVSNSFHYYEKFQFKKLVAGIGDFVLVSNADSAEPDTEEGCDPARILSLYEDPSNNNDPYRARVQWFSRPSDLPSSSFVNTDHVNFMEREVLEDHRPFNMDVSIETFFKKCSIRLIFTKDTNEMNNLPQYHYFCRYRLTALSKRKVQIEPVREEERRALELLRTPNKNETPLKSNIPKTPNSLIKRMNRVSLSEQRSWSVSKNEGNKILLKRALLTDKSEKDSPKKTPSKLTPKSSITETPRSTKLESRVIEELLSTVLIENSDDELPTLIIKQYVPSTPKRKQSISKTTDETPKKILIFEEDAEKEILSTRSRRATKTPINYMETEVSPVKRTPRTVVQKTKVENSDVPIFKEDYKKETLSTPSRRVRKPINYMETEVSPIKRTPRKVVKKTKVENSGVLNFEEDDEKETLATRSRRIRTPMKYMETELSPVKRTPRKVVENRDILNFKKDDDSGTISTRSRRVSRISMNYLETEVSPVKRTPRKVVQKTKEGNSDDDFTPEPITPKTSRTPKAPRATPNARTPRMRRIMTSQLTPTLHSRAHAIDNTEAFLKENKSLPGREQQMEEILSFVRTKLLDGVSGCMYISGVPGTGKTATVCAALKILKEEGDLPNFQLVEVNGMRIAEPRQAYVQIYKQLTGKSVVWEQACTLLEKRFTNTGPRRTPTVLLVDELDALCTRRQDVLYSIMEWAAHNSALLTVLAVANTMDLPERALASRVASRLGLTRLTFPPYTHTQLQRIVATRLADADVTPDAVQLIARKVAAVSGDARRALALCGRALELAEGAQAGLGEVQRALAEAASSAAVRAVRACAPADRLMLRAVAAEVERTGSEETTLSRALMTAAALVALEGRPYRTAPSIRPPTPSQALAICMRLAAQRLLLLEPKAAEPKLLLNISADDVHYATRQFV